MSALLLCKPHAMLHAARVPVPVQAFEARGAHCSHATCATAFCERVERLCVRLDSLLVVALLRTANHSCGLRRGY